MCTSAKPLIRFGVWGCGVWVYVCVCVRVSYIHKCYAVGLSYLFFNVRWSSDMCLTPYCTIYAFPLSSPCTGKNAFVAVHTERDLLLSTSGTNRVNINCQTPLSLAENRGWAFNHRVQARRRQPLYQVGNTLPGCGSLILCFQKKVSWQANENSFVMLACRRRLR